MLIKTRTMKIIKRLMDKFNRIEKSIANLEKYREEKNNEIIVNLKGLFKKIKGGKNILKKQNVLMILFFDYRTTIKAYKKN